MSQDIDLITAVNAMRRLNYEIRLLTRCEIKDIVYNLKEAMIAYLYQHDYCIDVAVVETKITCSHLRKSAEGKCLDCKGTGVFAKNRIYHYLFRVDGFSFSWHQPVKRSLPDVVVTTERNLFNEISIGSVQGGIINDDVFTVWEFLKDNNLGNHIIQTYKGRPRERQITTYD